MALPSHSWLVSALTIVAFIITSSSAAPIKSRESNDTIVANGTASFIEWAACASDLDFPENLQCANFSVPIDWDKPWGEHFDLGLVKLPAIASNYTSKIGSLFINPGGPGGKASSIVAAIANGGLPYEELLASFDLIGLDPRGVGLSHQVQCNMSIYAERVSLFPTTQEQFDTLKDKNRRLGESCREMTGPLLEHVDTISVVKDHEAVRIALGNEPINFLGLSYGTQLGSQYAQLFPKNIRTMALDGILQHSASEASNILIETSTYSLVLAHFFDWASKNETSPLHGQDVEQFWYSLLANATEKPIAAEGCNGTNCRTDVNAEEIRFEVQGYLLFTKSWPTLALALYNASHGDAGAFSAPLDEPGAVAGLAIECLDWTHNFSDDLAGVLAKKDMATHFAPLTQGASQTWALQHQCIGWPVPVKNPPKKLHVKTETTILMVNSDSDPSTGYPWALGVLEEIENTVFVTRKGDGHTSFLLGGEAANLTVEYLVTGLPPKDGLFTSS